MKTYDTTEVKGLVIPKWFIHDELVYEWQTGLEDKVLTGITLKLARQLQGCLIGAWMGNANCVQVSFNYGETDISLDVEGIPLIEMPFIKGDPFLIAENEGEGSTIIINRPNGLYEGQQDDTRYGQTRKHE